MSKQRWILAGAIAMTFSSLLLAKPGTVTTRDGQKYEGDITEKAEDVVVNIRGVETVITRDNIESIAYSEAFDVEFAERMGKLEPDDAAGRIALARWAFDSRRYDKAREALEAAIAIDANNREAYDMLALVRSQVRLEEKRRAEAAQPPAPRPDKPANGAPSSGGLSAEHVNDIRQKELRINDNVTIRFENDVRRRFAEYARRNLVEITRQRPAETAIMIFNKGEPGMAADVKITADPPSMLEFRRTIMPVLLNTCATANCHGATGAGNFKLIVPASNDGDVYANFLKLATTGKKTGGGESSTFFGGGEERMLIERGHGERSLLANYMLPLNTAEIPHPPAQGYDGAVRSTSDPKYRAVVKWMNESLRLPAPDYGRPNIASSATQPATAPATQPEQ